MWICSFPAVVCALFVALLKGAELVALMNQYDPLVSAAEFAIEEGAEEPSGL